MFSNEGTANSKTNGQGKSPSNSKFRNVKFEGCISSFRPCLMIEDDRDSDDSRRFAKIL